MPNGRATLLKFTEQGKTLLTLSGIEVKSLPKNASLEHEYYRELVVQQYRAKGYKVKKEVPIGEGKAIDLVVKKDGKEMAIEIETGKSDVDGNVRKCKEAEFRKAVVVYPRKPDSPKT